MMKKQSIFLCLILLAAVPIATCNDVTWTDEDTHTIDWDEPEFSAGSFTIKLTDFDGEGSVMLEIIDNEEETGEAVATIVLTVGEVWDNDEIRLKCEDATDKDDLESIGRWEWAPAAEITSWVAEREEPDIAIDISTDEDEYLYGDEITAEITIDNEGDGEIYNVLLNVSLDGLNLTDGDQLRYIGTIRPDDSRLRTVKMRFSMPPADGTIRVEATGRDEYGTPYYEVESRTVELKPPLIIRKFATPDVCCGGTVYVSISVRNIQNYAIRSITLSDEVPEQFNVTDYGLNQTFDIPPKGEINYQYHLIAGKPGSFTLPEVSASWNRYGEQYEAYSDSPAVDVHGAFIDVVKTIEEEHAEIGETVNVTIVITNTGDLPASIRLIDRIPENASYVSGKTNLTTLMRSHETEQISYAIRIDSPDVQIEKPLVTFEEMVCDEKTVNYTGNYDVTMPVTVLAASTRASDLAEVVQTPNPRETVKPVSVGGEEENRTARREINIRAREVQRNIESVRDMAMPGFGWASSIISIMILYTMRRIF
ncbi:MAG TPA: DUF11 domain-containing protein [Methanosarcinales archaeon]|nr:DUF11 domain-containing protein [Methanosarcinales archaeon]